MSTRNIVLSAALLSFAPSPASWGGQPRPNSSAVKSLFANPPPEYSTAPLWVWNDDLTDELVRATLHDLADQNIKQVFIHPRPGLMTPYLSEAWFDLWKVALAEARRLDMNVWIYDENSYPSGFAGGWVPAEMPESRGRSLGVREQAHPPQLEEEIVALFRLSDGRYEDLTAALRRRQPLPGGPYLVFFVRRAPDSPWHGGKCYVDLLYPGVTEKFIDITLEAYRRQVGAEFGRRVPGVFTDEPQIRSAWRLPWTEHLPAAFEQRWGYRLTDHLPCLWQKVGDWKRVRHNYYQVLLEQFIERWAKPMYDYCRRHDLEFTGHYWEHEWNRHLFGPDNMAMYAWQQRPGIDTLFNQYSEDVHAQFGNVRAVKELSSVANQLGCPRTLCEAYGAAGWDVCFEDLKRIGDWLYVLGVNTLDQHLSYVSIRGARKRDHPESFSYHEPWWAAYHVQATYFARLSAALSSGQEINRILLIEPTSTLWLYTTEAPGDPRYQEVAAAFQELATTLAKQQVEYDIGCEDILARHGAVNAAKPGSPNSAKLLIGRRAYELVVLPPMLENLNSTTVDFLAAFVDGGGTVLCCGEPPALVDGRPSDRLTLLSQRRSWTRVEPAAVPARLLAWSGTDFVVRSAADDKGILFHHRRRLNDGELLFLVNTSIESPCAGTVRSPARGVEQWDPESGQVRPYSFETSEKGVQAALELPPCGSLLLFLSDEPRPAASRTAPTSSTIAPVAPTIVRRLQPNVLVLDYVDVTAGGETKANTYVYQANQFAFQKNGLERNPWDNAVQFRDELISKTFPPESGFEATYRFTIEGVPLAALYAVVERADLYTITCNGRTVAPVPGAWWLDKAFTKIDITAAARAGENRLTIKAAPFTVYHELEAAYILGDFHLRDTDSGFAIVPTDPLGLGPWNQQGQPFYGGEVAYTQTFDVRVLAGRYRVALPAWYGSVARVLVNGNAAGYVYCQPWELDVTDSLTPGMNTIEVVVIGTLKNTLGPHHGNPPLGIALPAMFQTAPYPGPPPGSKYANVGYGLFEPFVLERLTP